VSLDIGSPVGQGPFRGDGGPKSCGFTGAFTVLTDNYAINVSERIAMEPEVQTKRVVHKFTFGDDGRIAIMGHKPKPVLVAAQYETLPTLWIEYDPNGTEERIYQVFGTGHCVTGTHIGSAVVGAFVWHVYDVTDYERRIR
jgi:hypothetical protein